MDTPELVAKKSLEALLAKEPHVIFGGDERLKESKLNFENPLKFDKKVLENYDDRKQASLGHKAL